MSHRSDKPTQPNALEVVERISEILSKGHAGGAALQIVVDYDGTLVPIVADPTHAVFAEEPRERFKALGMTAGIEIIVVSGRDRAFLEEQFRDFPITLVAEHGAFHRSAERMTWIARISPCSNALMPEVLAILQKGVANLAGSNLEHKEFGISWHYRRAETQDRSIVDDVRLELERALLGTEYMVLEGHKLLEVKPSIASKGEFLSAFLVEREKRGEHPNLIVIGDDLTDEAMFPVAQLYGGVTIHVGGGQTKAEYRLSSPEEVMTFLERIRDGLSSN